MFTPTVLAEHPTWLDSTEDCDNEEPECSRCDNDASYDRQLLAPQPAHGCLDDASQNKRQQQQHGRPGYLIQEEDIPGAEERHERCWNQAREDRSAE